MKFFHENNFPIRLIVHFKKVQSNVADFWQIYRNRIFHSYLFLSNPHISVKRYGNFYFYFPLSDHSILEDIKQGEKKDECRSPIRARPNLGRPMHHSKTMTLVLVVDVVVVKDQKDEKVGRSSLSESQKIHLTQFKEANRQPIIVSNNYQLQLSYTVLRQKRKFL